MGNMFGGEEKEKEILYSSFISQSPHFRKHVLIVAVTDQCIIGVDFRACEYCTFAIHDQQK
jgi:hypothetical protein